MLSNALAINVVIFFGHEMYRNLFVSSQYLSIKFPNYMHAHKATLYYDEWSTVKYYYKNMKNGKPTLGNPNWHLESVD